jgi:hypothetical protein
MKYIYRNLKKKSYKTKFSFKFVQKKTFNFCAEKASKSVFLEKNPFEAYYFRSGNSQK